MTRHHEEHHATLLFEQRLKHFDWHIAAVNVAQSLSLARQMADMQRTEDAMRAAIATAKREAV